MNTPEVKAGEVPECCPFCDSPMSKTMPHRYKCDTHFTGFRGRHCFEKVIAALRARVADLEGYIKQMCDDGREDADLRAENARLRGEVEWLNQKAAEKGIYASELEQERAALLARIKEMEPHRVAVAEAEPCSLKEAAEKSAGEMSLIHQYDAAACCALVDDLRRQLEEAKGELSGLRECLKNNSEALREAVDDANKAEAERDTALARVEALEKQIASERVKASMRQSATVGHAEARVAALEAVLVSYMKCVQLFGSWLDHRSIRTPSLPSEVYGAWDDVREKAGTDEQKATAALSATPSPLAALTKHFGEGREG